jgi:putative ABC transport system permease protein
VWSEAAYVTIGGLLFGAVAGWGLSYVIVKILTGVFDPPPEHLSIPWAYLSVLAVATAKAVGAAGAGMLRATPRPAVEIVRGLYDRLRCGQGRRRCGDRRSGASRWPS